MTVDFSDTVRRLHQSGYQAVISATGGGSLLFGYLLSIPGGSRFLLDGRIPYSEEAAVRLIGPVDSFCSERTARRLASEAFLHAVELKGNTPAALQTALGFGLTASLRPDRPKKGEHRVHFAAQGACFAASGSLILRKGGRSRQEEELLAAGLGLTALRMWTSFLPPDWNGGYSESGVLFDPADTSEWGRKWADALIEAGLFLFPEESISLTFIRTAPELARLSAGLVPYTVLRAESNRFQSVSAPKEEEHLIFPGSFRPIHSGHCGMVREAQKRLSRRCALEISLQNADKPPIDPIDLFERLGNIEAELPQIPVYLTGFPYFRQKGAFFAPAVFLLGADTLRRLDNPVYDGGEEAHREVLRELARNCRFLIFARREGETLYALDNMTLSSELRRMCDAVPPEVFTDDISSTQIRNSANGV